MEPRTGVIPADTDEVKYTLDQQVEVYDGYDSSVPEPTNKIDTITFAYKTGKTFTVGKKALDTSVTAKTYYAQFTYKYTKNGTPDDNKDKKIVAEFTIQEDFDATIDPSTIFISQLGTIEITIKNKIL